MEGRICLVTGATDGIGRHTAFRLAKDGATVLIHGRNRERGESTARWIRDSTGSNVQYFNADFADLSQVRELAKQIKDAAPRLDVLDNNAGVFAEQYVKTVDGNELTFQVNVLAPYLLTAELLDLIKMGSRPRIINVASISQSSSIDFDNLNAEKGFNSHSTYSLSKLCDVLLTYSMVRALKGTGVTVNTLDPGTVNTKMLFAGWGPCGIEVNDANDQHWLATSPSLEGVTGKYYVGRRETPSAKVSYDETVQDRLWAVLEDLTRRSFP
eukprot:tig00021428_g21153.t1